MFYLLEWIFKNVDEILNNIYCFYFVGINGDLYINDNGDKEFNWMFLDFDLYIEDFVVSFVFDCLCVCFFRVWGIIIFFKIWYNGKLKLNDSIYISVWILF